MKHFGLLLMVTVGLASCRPHDESTEPKQNKIHLVYFPDSEDRVELIYNDTISLASANLKPATKTVFLLDGFTAPASTPFLTETKDTYSGHDDMNIITVDWSAYSGWGRSIGNQVEYVLLYHEILFTQMPLAGLDLANFIHFIVNNTGIGYKDIVLIGHSMGAHTASSTGRFTQNKFNETIGRIIGLDPSLQFSFLDSPMRLGIGDADVVEIYNTNRKWLGDSYPATGDITIYVNGADSQPCQNRNEIKGPTCSDHRYSWKLYNYLALNDTIKACPCRGAACLCTGCEMKCGDDGISIGPHLPPNARGSYHVKTGALEWNF